MLNEERRNLIVRTVNEKGVVGVRELVDLLQISESTLRRDLIGLDSEGLIEKIHGGAAKKGGVIEFAEMVDVSERHKRNMEQKKLIAKRAAQIVTDKDIVYIDAGSTTECVIDYLPDTRAVFVTNASMHATKLMRKGFKVYVVGGELRRRTEAYVGTFAFEMLKNFNFTVGFFGADGVHPKAGYATPEESEAVVKSFALSHCKRAYALCDSSKFGKTAFVTFAALDSMTLISEAMPDFIEEANVILAK